MSIYASSTPVFNFFEDDDGVFVCELTPGMVRALHGMLEEAMVMAHEKGRWVPAPCVALTKQLGNATRALQPGRPPFPTESSDQDPGQSDVERN
jgi:hypothetical protein